MRGLVLFGSLMLASVLLDRWKLRPWQRFVAMAAVTVLTLSAWNVVRGPGT
ncbi:hypothetical protein GCM10008959_32600 [Deinococcus seoulensis]|uniref:Uncharacterized protein n=1 Tax=Deinococcus seoulensis TaxID=1837379 RepID=A0ABQ2RYU3_9DEIO|nr:hypothetical protein GCM10008959_32600 [Deinococcus seoulensis]